METGIRIGNCIVGGGRPAYIVAEMSANHHNDFREAVRILEAAREAGADAVKIQTYRADSLTIDCDREAFRIKDTLWGGRTLYDLYAEAATPWEWQPELKQIAGRLGMDLFSSPFDGEAVDFLERMEVPAYKVASFEIVDIGLIEKMAATGKPLILSTGMASEAEIGEALEAARRAGSTQQILLKCTSAYPAPPESMNLRTLPAMAAAFGVPAGISDHTLGIAVPVAAVALGACLVEKHFTLSRSIAGPDSAFSLEPQEFQAMVDAVRTAEKALGGIRYGIGPAEDKSLVFRRSLFVVADVKAGERFSGRNLRSIRPGYGLPPRHLPQILGRRARIDIERGTPLGWHMIDETHHHAGASLERGDKVHEGSQALQPLPPAGNP